MRRALLKVAAIAAVLVLAAPDWAWACATCFGDPDSPMTEGLNKGILTLLGCIALVQVGIVRVIWGFRKRSRAMRERSAVQAREVR